MVITKRNIVTCILLSIVTCGIYGIYWWYTIAKTFHDSNSPNNVSTTPVVTLLLTIVTCGIYGIYVNYKWGKQTPEIFAMYGMAGEDRSTIYLILSILQFSIVNYCLIQNDFNTLADSGNAPGGGPDGYMPPVPPAGPEGYAPPPAQGYAPPPPPPTQDYTPPAQGYAPPAPPPAQSYSPPPPPPGSPYDNTGGQQ